MSFLGKFGIGSMNLRRRKPRRCFPLTLGPLDPGSLGNDGEVDLPCPALSHFTRLFSSPDCTQISEQCSVLYCELCPWLWWTTWWEDLILGKVAEDMIMSLSETVTPEFDTIMCLSTTKVGMQFICQTSWKPLNFYLQWIHLNFGDEGLKRVFRRIYAQLRPGDNSAEISIGYHDGFCAAW